jgi:hypothetical protein
VSHSPLAEREFGGREWDEIGPSAACGPPLFVGVGSSFGLWQTREEDSDELRRRRSPHLGPGVRQVVLSASSATAAPLTGPVRWAA